MNLKKNWVLFPVILLALTGMIMVGCSGPTDPTPSPPPPTGNATWTLQQKGGVVDTNTNTVTATTTHIIVTFDQAVASFPTVGVAISGAAKKDTAPVKGDGNSWEIPIKDVTSGTVTVLIDSRVPGVETGTKTVVVYKQGDPIPTTYTAEADGEANAVSSTRITFTFSEAVTGLTDTEITLTGAAADKKAGLTGSGTTWTLPITAKSEGNITVKILHSPIEATVMTVLIHYKVPSANENYDITELTLVPGEDDNPTAGKIEGDDFDAVMLANRGSFLRITVDTSGFTSSPHGTPGPGWGIGAVGNFTNDDGDFDGQINLGYAWPPAGKDYADVPLAEAKRYVNMLTDNFLYVNIWENCKVVKIELYAKKVADTPPELGDGVIALIGVPSGDDHLGKGKIGYVDYIQIINSPDDSILKFYCTGSGNIGRIGKNWDEAGSISINPGAGGVFKITVAQLKVTGIETTKEIIINVWGDNNNAINKIELCYPEEDTGAVETVDLVDNSPYGYHAIMRDYFTSQDPQEGDTYTLSVEFTSDQNISWLSFSVVDNGEPDWPWTVISADSTGIGGITANERKTAEVTITITATPSTNAQHLVLETGSDDALQTEATLLFWVFDLVKN